LAGFVTLTESVLMLKADGVKMAQSYFEACDSSTRSLFAF
jgi:hypothetical protein